MCSKTIVLKCIMYHISLLYALIKEEKNYNEYFFKQYIMIHQSSLYIYMISFFICLQ